MKPRSVISHPESVRRILVRGVNWLGDAVMTTPALLGLRAHFPDTHIAILSPAKIQDLWRNHPAMNEVIPFNAEESSWAIARRLRAGKFDLALVLPNSPRSAIEPWLARIPQRLGYARPWRNLFLTAAIPSRPAKMIMRKRSVAEIQKLVAGRQAASSFHRVLANGATALSHHQISDYLELIGALGANSAPLAPQLTVTEGELEAARRKFGIEMRGPIFGLNAGAEYGPAKRWPAERFIAAARAIRDRTQCVWLIFGGKADAELAGQIEAALRGPQFEVYNLAGQTSLRELCATLKLCRVLLSNDTGPMHVAAALGTAVVVPFGSTSPELTGPGLPGDPRHQLLKSDAPCAPCFLRECPIDFRCMNGISVAGVVEAFLEAAQPVA